MPKNAIIDQQALVEEARRDPEKFGHLMERYSAPLFLYIRRLSGRPKEDVQDLLQEVFIKIYQRLNEYDSRMKFSSWAYRIAHNHVIDYFRYLNARPRTSALEEPEWEKLIGGSIEIEKELVSRDCVEKVKKAIDGLPLRYREALILRFIEEKDYEEMMDILKKPRGTVATLIARGKKMVREKLAEDNHCH